MKCALEVATVHRRHLHSRHAVNDLVRKPWAMKPGADHADANGPSLRFSGSQALSTMIMNSRSVLRRDARTFHHSASELRLDPGQKWKAAIPFADLGNRQRPGQAKLRVVVPEAALSFRGVELARLIGRLVMSSST